MHEQIGAGSSQASLVGIWSYLSCSYEIKINEDGLHFEQYDSVGALVQGELVEVCEWFIAELTDSESRAFGTIRLQLQVSGLVKSNFKAPDGTWGCDVTATKLPQMSFVPVFAYAPMMLQSWQPGDAVVGPASLQAGAPTVSVARTRYPSGSLRRVSSIEVEWEVRLQNRQDDIMNVKSKPIYYEHQHIPTHRRPQTPRRAVSQREWESSLAEWHCAWREIDGVSSLMALGWDEMESLRAWHMAEDEKEHYAKKQETRDGVRKEQGSETRRNKWLRRASRKSFMC